MRKIYNILIICSLLLALSSCGNDWLNLEPSDRIETPKSITTLNDVQAAVIGIYNQLQNYEYYGARMTYYGDVTGDDMQSNGDTKRCASFYRYAYTAENAPRSLWEQPYKVIRLANNILAVIDNIKVTDAQKATLNDLKGQALFFRALAHFDITRVYGYPYAKDNGASWGAAIITQSNGPEVKPSRNTVAECYNNLIIPDLVQASNLMIGTKNNTTGRVNKWGAKLLLSRVYLYKGDNVNALKEAEECISGAEASSYSLWTNTGYLSGWTTKFSSESLFELVNLITDRTGNEGIGYLCWDRGYDDIILTRSFWDLLSSDPNDVRIKLTTKGTKSPSSKSYNVYILKYANDPDVQNADVMILRLSESYLNAAEAAVKLNDNVKALKYLNPIVTRANPAKSVTGTVTLDRVLLERRLELFGEGHRAFDLLRNNKTIERVGNSHSKVLPDYAKSLDWNNFRIVLPVPKYETDANPSIKAQQNPGW
jgi:hypothetical protein